MSRGSKAAIAVLALLSALVVVTELLGRSVLEAAVRQRLADGGVTGEVVVSLGQPWRPSLGTALVTGRLDQLDVRLDEARLAGVDIAEADYRLSDVHVQASLRNRTVGASSLGAGSVRIVVDPEDLSGLVGDDVVVDDGTVFVGAAGERATVRVDGDDVVVLAGDRSEVELARFRARDPHLLPCAPQIRVGRRHILLECSGSELPGILRAPLGPTPSSKDAPPPDVQLQPPLTVDLDDPDGVDDGG